MENRLYTYADDSTLLAVVRKPADRSGVAAVLNRDLAGIQEWCNHWFMILNPNKTKALVVSRSRTVNPPHIDLVLSWVSICVSPNLDILGVKFDSMFRPCAWYRLQCSSKNWYFEVGEASLCEYLCDALLLLGIVLPIFEYCSPVLGSAAKCHLQLLKRQVYSVARLCPDHTFLSLCHRLHYYY